MQTPTSQRLRDKINLFFALKLKTPTARKSCNTLAINALRQIGTKSPLFSPHISLWRGGRHPPTITSPHHTTIPTPSPHHHAPRPYQPPPPPTIATAEE